MKLFVLCLSYGLSLLSIFSASIALSPSKGSARSISDEQKLNELSKTVSTYLHKLDGQANGGNLQLLHIYSATYQVVSGVLYNLYAEINENNSPVNCTIKFLERALIDFVKLDLECGAEKRSYAYVSSSTENSESSRRRRKRKIHGGYQNNSPNGINELKPTFSIAFDKFNRQHKDFDVSLVLVNGGRYATLENLNKEWKCQCECSWGLKNLKGEQPKFSIVFDKLNSQHEDFDATLVNVNGRVQCGCHCQSNFFKKN